MTMSTATAPQIARRTRSDGDRSRQRILEAAAQLATVQGLDRLSIGELAAHIGMSKSGLYAHFRSKEELQLATIDAAEAIFDEVVVGPMHVGRARHPGRAGPERRVPRSPRPPDLPGWLLLRVCLGRTPGSAWSGQGTDRRVRPPLEGALRRATSGSPSQPVTWAGRGHRAGLVRGRRVPPLRARRLRVPWRPGRAGACRRGGPRSARCAGRLRGGRTHAAWGRDRVRSSVRRHPDEGRHSSSSWP